jgi:SNF2 family DNA or RNA helicase
VVVTGRTSAKVNATRLKKFQANPTQYKVLLMTLKLGNMGLNLTDCNHVVHADPWWNPWATEQGDFRIRRPGQTKPIFITYFIMDDTIEVAIMNHTIRKKTLLTTMLARGDGGGIDEDYDTLSSEDATMLFDYEVDILPL